MATDVWSRQATPLFQAIRCWWCGYWHPPTPKMYFQAHGYGCTPQNTFLRVGGAPKANLNTPCYLTYIFSTWARLGTTTPVARTVRKKKSEAPGPFGTCVWTILWRWRSTGWREAAAVAPTQNSECAAGQPTQESGHTPHPNTFACRRFS